MVSGSIFLLSRLEATRSKASWPMKSLHFGRGRLVRKLRAMQPSIMGLYNGYRKFLQNLFQPQTISSGVPSSASYGTGQGMPPETDVLQRILGGNPVNVMQQAGITPDMAQPAPVPQAPQPAAQAPQPRRSPA